MNASSSAWRYSAINAEMDGLAIVYSISNGQTRISLHLTKRPDRLRSTNSLIAEVARFSHGEAGMAEIRRSSGIMFMKSLLTPQALKSSAAIPRKQLFRAASQSTLHETVVLF